MSPIYALAIVLAVLPQPVLAESTPVSAGGYTDEACTGQGSNTALVVTASSAYTANNEVGPLLAFNVARPQPSGRPSVILQSATLTSTSAQTAEFDVSLFVANPVATTWADKTAPAIVGSDKALVRGPIKLTSAFSGLGTHTVYTLDQIAKAIKIAPNNSITLWAVITTTGTPTFTTTSDLQLCLGVLQD